MALSSSVVGPRWSWGKDLVGWQAGNRVVNAGNGAL